MKVVDPAPEVEPDFGKMVRLAGADDAFCSPGVRSVQRKGRKLDMPVLGRAADHRHRPPTEGLRIDRDLVTQEKDLVPGRAPHWKQRASKIGNQPAWRSDETGVDDPDLTAGSRKAWHAGPINHVLSVGRINRPSATLQHQLRGASESGDNIDAAAIVFGSEQNLTAIRRELRFGLIVRRPGEPDRSS